MTLVALIWFVGGISFSATPAGAQSGAVIVKFETADGSTFRTLLESATDIARAEDALEGDGNAGIPNGELVAGNGGINAPHEWHLINVELVDMTIELCDGTATMVDEDLDYWLETVGRFCPWTATVISIELVVDELPNTGAGSIARDRQFPVMPIAGVIGLALIGWWTTRLRRVG